MIWLLLLFLASPCLAATSRYIDASQLKKEDQAALNLNFNDIDKELSTTVHKTSTETITGVKVFSSISISSITTTSYLDTSAGHFVIRTAAAIRGTITPYKAGELILNTTTVGEVCVSTGTASDTWSKISSPNTACSN